MGHKRTNLNFLVVTRQWSWKNGAIDRERDSAPREVEEIPLGSYTLAYSPSTFIFPSFTFGIEF